MTFVAQIVDPFTGPSGVLAVLVHVAAGSYVVLLAAAWWRGRRLPPDPEQPPTAG